MPGLSTAMAAPDAPVTDQVILTSVPGLENGASAVPWIGQLGCCVTRRAVTFAAGALPPPAVGAEPPFAGAGAGDCPPPDGLSPPGAPAAGAPGAGAPGVAGAWLSTPIGAGSAAACAEPPTVPQALTPSAAAAARAASRSVGERRSI